MARTTFTTTTAPSRRSGDDPGDGGINFGGFSADAPPSGLEQIGDTPFWGSPIEPVQPWDCERWPNSPYCGGTGAGDKFLDLGIDLSADQCSVCISIEPTLGYISLPPLTYCYIKPECQYKKPPYQPSECFNQDNLERLSEDLNAAMEDGNLKLAQNQLCIDPPSPPDIPENDSDRIIEIRTTRIRYDMGYVSSQDYFKPSGIGTPLPDEPATTSSETPPPGPISEWILLYRGPDRVRYKSIVRYGQPKDARSNSGYQDGEFFSTYNITSGLYYARYEANGQTFPITLPFYYADGYTYKKPNGRVYQKWDRGQERWLVAYDNVIINEPKPQPRPPEPPKPPTPREPEMSCNCQKMENLLIQILRRIGPFPTTLTTPNNDKVKKQKATSIADAISKWSSAQSTDFSEIYKVIEPRSFEKASYPMHLTHPGAKGDKPVRNFLQAWEVLVRQLDKVNGSWPIKLEIKDTNAAQKGNQSLKVEIWSISDAIRLLIENIIDTEGDVDTTTNLLVRMGAMLIQQHQVLAQIHATTANTEEYLDYKIKQKVISIPSTLNPILPADSKGFGQAKEIDKNTEEATESVLPEFMKNTELKVKITSIDEKRLLGERLYSIEKLTASAAAGNTVHYSGEETLKKILQGAMQLAEIESYLQRENVRKALGQQKTDIRDFEKQVEQGYPEAIGKKESDPEKPYGRPKSKAPKVKRTRRMK